MDRKTKEQVVEDLRKELDGVSAIILTEYRRLTVAKVVELRKKLRESSVKYRVVKNTLVKRAIEGTDKEFLGKHLVGPMAIAWSVDEPVAAAKVLSDFAKDNAALTVMGGYLSGKPLDPQGVKTLSELPGKDELRSMFLSVLQGPARKFVTLTSQAQRDFLSVVLQQREKLEEGDAAA